MTPVFRHSSDTTTHQSFFLSTEATAAVAYSSVPLRDIRSVALSAEASSTWKSMINGFFSRATDVIAHYVYNR